MHVVYDDIDKNLIGYIRSPGAVTEQTAFFYVTRRHWLEMLPEILTSGYMVLTVVAVAVNIDCQAAACHFWVGVGSGLLTLLALVYPFGIELFRWRRQIYYLTQNGYFHSYYDLARLAYRVQAVGWVTGSSAYQPSWYGWLGFDVGYLGARGPEGEIRTPLMPKPFALQRRLSESRSWRPPEVGDNGKGWSQ